MDTAIRRNVTLTNPNVVFDEGTDTLLRLGCYLFLEKVAQEAHETARIEGKKTDVNGDDVRRAATAILSEVRQF